MWSVRMRAMGQGGEHISGAEGLFAEKEVQRAVAEYSRRAFEHPRGRAEEVVIKVEELKERPEEITALPVCTLRCGSPGEAEAAARRLLAALGVSNRAVDAALGVLRGGDAMRGAALIDIVSGGRFEPDRKKGVRASWMGISRGARGDLSRRLARRGINTSTVREAIVLASKVASAKGVVAELCVSDDPDYTTGYLATGGLGYLRIPNIKRAGERRGGRAIFIKNAAYAESVKGYLERTPVLVTGVSGVRGEVEPDGLAGCNHS